MRALGFRVEPKMVHWAVVDGTVASPVLVEVDKVSAPKTFSEAQALSFYRSHVLLLVSQHAPSHAGIRYAEPTAQSSDSQRMRIEGVVLQALHEKALPIFTGAIKSMAAAMKATEQKPKQYFERDDLRGLDWSEVSHNGREAIFVATAALAEVG